MPFTILPQAAQDLFNLSVTPEQVTLFEQYAELLIHWNKTRANLTAITEPVAIEIRHFLDSLSLVLAMELRPGLSVIDVGTGAGFPGLPLKIVYPDLALTFLEATAKKIAFLEHVSETLGLVGVNYVNLRAEEAGQHAAHRAQYDVVTARAVAYLPVLAEYLLPLCKVGGRCIAMKGESAAAELAESKNALRILGGRPTDLIPVSLPGVAEKHYLIVIEKIAATPRMYPRRPGLPAKKPL